MATNFHIGIDLDNTIIDYDETFGKVGSEIGLLPPAHNCTSKEEVKSFLCRSPPGEEAWMQLQGQVYGCYIERARLSDGFDVFLRAMRERQIKLSIVSHKTRYGHFDPHRVNLWDAALGWLERRGFFDLESFGLERDDVHFLQTRRAKIARIEKIGCHLFIDDLPEVLADPRFPAATVGIWYAPMGRPLAAHKLIPHADWASVLAAVESPYQHYKFGSRQTPDVPF